MTMKQPVAGAKDMVRIAGPLAAASSFVPLLVLTIIFISAQAVLAVHGLNMPTETRDAVITVLATGFGLVGLCR